MEAATACRAVALQRRVDLNHGSAAVPSIDFDEGVLAVADNVDPVRLAALTIYLNEGVLAVADDFSSIGLAAIGPDFNPSLLVATAVDLNARSFFAWWTLVASYLCRAARDDQSGERNKHSSRSRTGHWAGRGHRGAKDAETVSPWQA